MMRLNEYETAAMKNKIQEKHQYCNKFLYANFRVENCEWTIPQLDKLSNCIENDFSTVGKTFLNLVKQ